MESTRVDLWLWSVRVHRTRSSATAACRAGQVRVNGSPAKAATQVRVGDRVEVTGRGHPRDLEVVRVIAKRVGAPLAAECVVDHGPGPPAAGPEGPVRERGSGRPTKRERRELDRFRGR